MTNISIISACNNNCKYCFQQETYHKANLMLTYDEILDIFDWVADRDKMGILDNHGILLIQIFRRKIKMTQIVFMDFIGYKVYDVNVCQRYSRV